MIEQRIIALDMEAFTNRMRRFELEEKVITLLNQLWDENCLKSSPRRTVQVNWEENGIEVTASDLRAPTFYFMNETKFWQRVRQPLKSMGTMVQGYNLQSEICHGTDQRTFKRVYYNLTVWRFKPILSASLRFHSHLSGGLRLRSYRAVAGNHKLSSRFSVFVCFCGGYSNRVKKLRRLNGNFILQRITFQTKSVRASLCVPGNVGRGGEVI